MHCHRSHQENYSHWPPRRSRLLASTIGVLVLVSACAKRPQVATPTEQGLYPPTEALGSVPAAPAPEGAAAPSVAQPSASGQAPPPQAPRALAHPEVPTPSVARPSAPEAHAPAATPPVSPAPAQATPQGSTEQGLYPPTEAPGSVPPARSEVVTAPPAPPREQPARQVAQAAPKVVSLEDIFFDFDKAEIRPDAKAGLAQDVASLQAHPTAAITIEGHCDERGTSEYNLGLGERRAHAAKDYLTALGIDPTRLTIISYGKERPFVLGHDEAAWRWNRRDHMVVGK